MKHSVDDGRVRRGHRGGIALAVAGFPSAFLLFVVACVLMMGGMVWMMVCGPGA